MKVTIDETAGFCWGVLRTVDIAEKTLESANGETMHVLGHIIHNPKEIERLGNKGLETISHEDFESIAKNAKPGITPKVIIRAHGEPPSTYQKAKDLGIELVDATCPLVTGLQNRVKRFHDKGYQVVIYGKPNHAEIIGIRGVIKDDCVIVLSPEEAIEKVDFTKPIVLFSQTTMEKPVYYAIKEAIESRVSELVEGGDTSDAFQFKNSLCKEVWGREKKVIEFAKDNDVVIFVAGRTSSNGKSLFKHMNVHNPRMYYIEDLVELDYSWFENAENIGISGATSTPQWYMDQVKEAIEKEFIKVESL
ncbi:MAG: 4-hydroxy-3-methylbut-2-enyl diphosphate reductase [Candidatus Kapabacteria bacterium]|nr:4-hydroxy-3-methylbut-2-enyl diphosphate reductase [Candidatus Kapabacteria bacterium]